MDNKTDNLVKVMRDIKDQTLINGICYTLEREDSTQAVRIILAATVGALIKKGETELVEKIINFLEEL